MNLPASLQALLNAPLEESPPPPLYPDTDGKTMADNSRQLRWIVLLYSNLCWLFRGRKDVAVHANMLWYVEEGDPKLRQAPDVFVIFGRPPGERAGARGRVCLCARRWLGAGVGVAGTRRATPACHLARPSPGRGAPHGLCGGRP